MDYDKIEAIVYWVVLIAVILALGLAACQYLI